jgi:hypothetical protein
MALRGLLLLLCCSAGMAVELMYDFGATITFDVTAPGSPSSSSPVPAVIQFAKEFDGAVFASTPHKSASDSWPTFSTVETVDGKSVLRPFPSWDVSASVSVVAFDIDRKGRVFAVCRTSEGDELKIWHLKTRKELHSVELPVAVSAVTVDDHGKSHTTIHDDESATVFMLSAVPSSGSDARLLMYTHQHQNDRIRAFQVPHGFDAGTNAAKLGISISGDGHTCYLSSPNQLWSFQTDSVKSGGSDLRMYPVCGQASSRELQGLMYHPVARALVFGSKGQLYKVNPLDAWSKSFEAQQVAVTEKAEVLPNIHSLSLDWKYDIVVVSSSADGTSQKIQCLVAMQLLHSEQTAEKVAMDYSDL